MYVKKQVYDKIDVFSTLPVKLFVSDVKRKYEDVSTYTFKQVYEEWKKVYFPTKEEIEEEKRTHRRTHGKFSVANKGNLASAFSNCKILHDRIYRDLTDLDFQEVINNTKRLSQ